MEATLHQTTTKVATAHGLLAEYLSPDEVLAAAKAARSAGYSRMDAYSPFPVHGLAEALGQEDVRVGWIVFICGCIGAIAGFGLQYWASVLYYPLNVGGKPFNSWPAFVPVTFECTVLLAAFGAFIGMFALNGLPRPHHPIFNASRFERASLDRFFLCIESADPLFDSQKTREFLASTGAISVEQVEE
jgi:hypothetical protein